MFSYFAFRSLLKPFMKWAGTKRFFLWKKRNKLKYLLALVEREILCESEKEMFMNLISLMYGRKDFRLASARISQVEMSLSLRSWTHLKFKYDLAMNDNFDQWKKVFGWLCRWIKICLILQKAKVIFMLTAVDFWVQIKFKKIQIYIEVS